MRKIILILLCSITVLAVDKDSEKLESECKTGNFRSCTRVGVQQAFGTHGYKKDYIKAREFLEKACNGSDGLGCKELGVLYEYGRGMEKNPTKAAEYYKIACEKKESFGCYYLSGLHKKGQGVAKDLTLAEKYRKQACELKLEMACKEGK